MKPIFLKNDHLGIVEHRLREVYRADTKRKRQVARNEAIGLLKALGLLPKTKERFVIAEGTNALGDRGFWLLVDEEVVEVQAEGPALQCLDDAHCALSNGHEGNHYTKGELEQQRSDAPQADAHNDSVVLGVHCPRWEQGEFDGCWHCGHPARSHKSQYPKGT